MIENARYYLEQGIEYLNQDDYDRAEESLRQSEVIMKDDQNKDSLEYVQLLKTWGSLYHAKKELGPAEKYYCDAKKIWEGTDKLDKNTLEYARLLHSLGGLYRDIRYDDRAKENLDKSHDIIERNRDKYPLEYAKSLRGLGQLYCDMGKPQKAKKYYLGLKAIYKREPEKNARLYAPLLVSLGMLHDHDHMGNFALAEKYYLASKNIWKYLPNKNHYLYAVLLGNLGWLYYREGKYIRAEKYLLKSKRLYKKTIGKGHPYYVRSLDSLSVLYLSKKKYVKALAFQKEASRQRTSQVNRNFSFFSEQEREKYWDTLSDAFEISYSLSWLHPVPKNNALNYNNALFTKGLLLRTTNAVRDAISGDPKFEELKKLRQQKGENEAEIKKIENDAEELEKSLVQNSSVFREFQTSLNTSWKNVKDKLRSGEAAVEFVSFELYDERWIDGTHYAALVLRHDMKAPEWVSLPDCEKTLLEFLNELNELQKKDPENEKKPQIYKQMYNEKGSCLYAAIWRLLESSLKGVKTVYYSPSGLLYKISFNAIPTKEGLPLMNAYDLNLISSTREIVNRENKTIEKPASGVIYSGLSYVVDEEDMKREAKPYNTPDQRKGSIDHWDKLLWSKNEGKDIEKILSDHSIPVNLYQGAAGNKESFKKLDGKKTGVIHLSTHGFYFSDIEKDNEERERLERLGGGKKVSKNPLMCSGLVLAGAERAWRNEPVTGVENGILLADDVARMNLVGAQLVVLSACETALGEVNNSEGVFGLQRAFKLAGAETLIMSLWPVNDKATFELMVLFYEKWLSGKNKQKAFKEAQQELKAKPQYSSPYYWAAFVMID